MRNKQQSALAAIGVFQTQILDVNGNVLETLAAVDGRSVQV